jgi:hypothetical protein
MKTIKVMVMLVLAASTSFAQQQIIKTLVPNANGKDTVWTYFTQEVVSIQKSSVRVEVHPYKAPVTPPTTGGGTTTPPDNGSPGAGSFTIVSGPIKAVSGKTYSNLLIDLKGASTTGIDINGVTGVTVNNCKIMNGKGFGIQVHGNSKNITITNSFITNIGFGLYAENAQTVKVNNNQWLNMNGINSKSFGHAIQFNNVNGGGNQINNNRIENTKMLTDTSSHPHDVINVYKSNGLPGDSIQVIGNWIRGGQVSLWPNSNSGAAGIVVGDLGGSYQVCRNNILVNPGYVGIQAQGGSHIKVDHNKIYSDGEATAALVGMSWGNYSGAVSTDVTYAYNQVTFFSQGWKVKTKPARENNYGTNGNSNGTDIILINNTWSGLGGNGKEANLTAGILPAVIITMK